MEFRYNSVYRGPIQGNVLYAMQQVFVDGVIAVGASGHPAKYDENNVVAKAAYNRAIVMGENVFWLQGNSVFTSNFTHNQVGDAWVEFPLPSGTNYSKRSLNTGLYGVLISGIAGIATIHSPNHNTVLGSCYLSTTSNWSHTEETTLLNINLLEASGGFRGETVYKNKVYAAIVDGYVIYDPTNSRITQGMWPQGVRGPVDFCPFNGRLYAHGHTPANGAWNLYEMVEGVGPTYKATTGAIFQKDYNLEGRGALFTDRENLYSVVFVPAVPGSGWAFYGWAPSGVDGITCLDDVTTDFGPPDARGGPVDANITDRGRVTVFCQQNQDPEGSERQQFYFDRAGGTGIAVGVTGAQVYYPDYKQYVLDGLSNLSADSSVDEAGRLDDPGDDGKKWLYSYQMAYANTKNGGGDRIEIYSGRPIIDVRTIIPSGNIVGITYRIVANSTAFPAGTPCTVQFRYDTKYHSPRSPCVLSNPSIGTLSANGYVISTTAQSGIDYYCEWDTTDNGLTGRVQTAIVGFISTSGTF